MIRLEVRNGERAGEILESSEDLLSFGRAESNDLVLPDHHISGQHGSIVYTAEGYVLRDHHSTNGTRVLRESKRLELADIPGRELLLSDGDEIQLGETGEPVCIALGLSEDEDGARIVSVRKMDELGAVEAKVGADRELLRGLYEAQKVISQTLDLEPAIDAVASEVFRFLTRATHVTVVLREDDETKRKPRYVPVGTRARGGATNAEAIPITRSVFRKVVSDRTAVLAADAKRDVGESASMMAAQILSTIGVPLWQGEEILGVLQVDNRDASGIFKESDLDVLALLAQTASQAFVRARMMSRLRVAEERQRSENAFLKQREERRRFEGMIGESPAMMRLQETIKKVVDTRVSVLIEGATGTGKELVASALHYWSNRREKLFVAQNCAAVPENLLESELFGHRKGAFTGATEEKKGLFELADGGTLFLDEVGEMPVNLQAKLLRVLQEGEIRPIGASKTRKVDVRIVAATNRDLEKEVAEGRFREDLYYRLKVFPLALPPLRERREDIPLLANHFIRRYAEEFGRAATGFSQPAMELLTAYEWPGNIRELENEVQRILIQMGNSEFVQPQDLSQKMRKAESVVGRVRPKRGTLKEMVEEVERWILREALEEHGNNKSATAKSLGITREGLHKKLKNYGMT